MCQLTYHLSQKIAESDIICYKLLREICDNHFVTYYQDYPVALGKLYEEDLFKFDHITIPCSYSSEYPYIIEGGGFHLFTDDSELLDKLWYFQSTNLVIAECTVPAGTPYYKGIFKILAGYVGKTIVSQKMRIDYVYDQFKFYEKIKERYEML